MTVSSGSKQRFSLKGWNRGTTPAMTDVSLRHVRVVAGWPVPAVPVWFRDSGTDGGSINDALLKSRFGRIGSAEKGRHL